MSFPVYDEYKDSGYEWVGTVPNQWQVRRVKSLVAEPLKYGANESAEDEDRTQPRFVRITDIDDDGRLRDETFKSLPAEVAEPYLLRQGDVLLARSGATVGKSFIYSEEWGTACFAGYLIRARLRASECLPVWLYYFCQTDGYWGYVVGSQIQATIQNVSAEKYANLYLPLPPLDEQKAISSFLDVETSKIDALVSEQRRLIELLKEKRQAVISHAVTKGLNPNAPMKPSGIQWFGDVPEHWDVVRMRRVGEVGQGCAFSHSIQGQESGELPWFKVRDMNRPGNEIEMRTADNYVSAELAEEIRATIFPADTVIFPRVGAALLTNKRRILVTPSITDDNVYGFIPTNIHPRFLYLLLLLVDMDRLCSPGLVPTVTFSVIKDLYIPLPPATEQNEIVGRVEGEIASVDRLVAEAERAIELLQERRTALISAAVTGKIDVREFAYQETA